MAKKIWVGPSESKVASSYPYRLIKSLSPVPLSSLQFLSIQPILPRYPTNQSIQLHRPLLSAAVLLSTKSSFSLYHKIIITCVSIRCYSTSQSLSHPRAVSGLRVLTPSPSHIPLSPAPSRHHAFKAPYCSEEPLSTADPDPASTTLALKANLPPPRSHTHSRSQTLGDATEPCAMATKDNAGALLFCRCPPNASHCYRRSDAPR